MLLRLKSFSLILCSVLTLTMVSCDTLRNAAAIEIARALTNDDIANALKLALELGIGNGSDALSQKGGYLNSAYRILLPPEARQVTDKLKNIPGFSQVESLLLEKINAGAEDAAIKAKPIFINAIKQMTFSDALGILMGEKNAATNFLKRSTYEQLYQAFNPSIVQSLDKFEARKYWGDIATTYNQLPFSSNKVNVNLDDYVTREALNGLFAMVENKERSIRANQAERITTLLQQVFAKQDGR